MDIKTDISTSSEGSHAIYGQDLAQLIRTATFSDAVFLLFAKKMPSPAERSFLDALLVSAAEHGVEAPSLYMPRISAASGNPLHVAIAAGVLGIGESHGGAGEAAAELLARTESPQELVAEYVRSGARIPGFGHKVYTATDPRAAALYEKAKELSLPLSPFEKAYAIERELASAKGKTFPLNIDGAFGAGVLALGLVPACAKALFVLSRVAGMGAHALEELERGGSYRRLPKR